MGFRWSTYAPVAGGAAGPSLSSRPFVTGHVALRVLEGMSVRSAAISHLLALGAARDVEPASEEAVLTPLSTDQKDEVTRDQEVRANDAGRRLPGPPEAPLMDVPQMLDEMKRLDSGPPELAFVDVGVDPGQAILGLPRQGIQGPVDARPLLRRVPGHDGFRGKGLLFDYTVARMGPPYVVLQVRPEEGPHATVGAREELEGAQSPPS